MYVACAFRWRRSRQAVKIWVAKTALIAAIGEAAKVAQFDASEGMINDRRPCEKIV